MIGKIFTILGLVSVVVAQTQAVDFSDEIELLQDFASDVYSIKYNAHTEIQKNKKEYKRQLADIIERASYEVELNWAQVVQPVAQEYAELLKTIEMSPKCNQTCVSD